LRFIPSYLKSKISAIKAYRHLQQSKRTHKVRPFKIMSKSLCIGHQDKKEFTYLHGILSKINPAENYFVDTAAANGIDY